MKTVAKVATTEKNTSLMIEHWKFPLGSDRIQRENRMSVGCPVQDTAVIDPVIAVQGDKVVTIFGNSLKGIHPIMRACALMTIWPLLDTEIPRGPGKTSSGHHRSVGVKGGFVFLIMKGG